MITKSKKISDYIQVERTEMEPHFEQTIYGFDNGYGTSVIHGTGSYGLEVAVLYSYGDGDFAITYDTPLTDDVIKYVEDLDSVLEQIKGLEG